MSFVLLGILNAQASGVAAAGSYDLLETEILTGSQASVTFSSLNSTYGADYQHLQLRIVARSDRADQGEYIHLQFNGDSGNNYTSHVLRGNGSTVVSANPRLNYSAIQIEDIAAANDPANSFGPAIIDVLDSFESTKNTTVRALAGMANPYDIICLTSGLWNNTAALTSIYLEPFFGSNFVTGSRFSLYGLRSA